MLKPILKLNEPRAKTIGFLSRLFSAGVIWDRFPKGVYISSLCPREECFFDALETFFNALEEQNLKFRYSAPEPKIEVFLISKGYTRYVDAPGVPFYTNTTIPRSCVPAPRTKEETVRLTQTAELSGSEFVD